MRGCPARDEASSNDEARPNCLKSKDSNASSMMACRRSVTGHASGRLNEEPSVVDVALPCPSSFRISWTYLPPGSAVDVIGGWQHPHSPQVGRDLKPSATDVRRQPLEERRQPWKRSTAIAAQHLFPINDGCRRSLVRMTSRSCGSAGCASAMTISAGRFSTASPVSCVMAVACGSRREHASQNFKGARAQTAFSHPTMHSI